jgi:hypothetical protein
VFREIDLPDNNLKIVYGMVLWEQLLHNIRQRAFTKPLELSRSGTQAPKVCSCFCAERSGAVSGAGVIFKDSILLEIDGSCVPS